MGDGTGAGVLDERLIGGIFLWYDSAREEGSVMSSSRDHYEVLQAHPNAGAEVIRAAYRRLARMYHPDAGVFKRVVGFALMIFAVTIPALVALGGVALVVGLMRLEKIGQEWGAGRN